MSYQPQKLVFASSAIDGIVVNSKGEDLGKIKELMIDLQFGRIGFVILDFGRLFGLGHKYFVVPWDALSTHYRENRFHLNIPREVYENADGFGQDDLPNMSDRAWGERIYTFYGYRPYWVD
jgi:sporulation protein YlmC with PRC-barrel domain